MENNVPNFDAMDVETLKAWWVERQHMIQGKQRKDAAKMFPLKPRGYVRAAQNLVNYAVNKSVAMNLRLEGKIDVARQYELIADNIYNNLPDYAKW